MGGVLTVPLSVTVTTLRRPPGLEASRLHLQNFESRHVAREAKRCSHVMGGRAAEVSSAGKI